MINAVNIQNVDNEGSKTQHVLHCFSNHWKRISLIALGVLAVIAALSIGLAHINSIASFSLGGAGLALIAGVVLKAYFFPRRDIVIIGDSFLCRGVHRKMGLRVMLRYRAFYELQKLKDKDYESIAAQKERVIFVYTPGIQSDASFVSENSPSTLAMKKCEGLKIPYCIYIRNAGDIWNMKKTSLWEGKPYILGASSKLPFTRNFDILTNFLNQPI